MARYIDAEKLEKEGWSASRTYPQDAHTMVYETKKMTDFPTADVVEIVRCKDCKHSVKHQLGYGCGMNYHLATNGNWFCADGERRDDAEIH